MNLNPIETAGRLQRDGMALNFTNYAAALALCKGDRTEAAALFAYRNPQSRYLDVVRKAAIPAASTTVTSWGGALSPLTTLGDAFVEFLNPLTVIGRMSGFQPMPFNVRAPRAIAGASVGWVGGGSPVLVSDMAFEEIVFKPAKIAGIAVLTKEVVMSADPDAQQLVRKNLSGTVVSFSDTSFLDPSIAEVADVSPASITYGAPTVASVGTNAVAIAEDFKALFSLVTTNLLAPYLVMTPRTAIALATNQDCIHLTRNLGPTGGFIMGVPVITSANAPADGDSPGDSTIILIDAAEVFMNQGGIELDASEHTILQMASAPDSPVTAATQFRSMWQENLLALMIRRYIRWQRRREGSVAVLTGVNYE
jgi:HK97 family phage major capsid protein